MTKLAWLLKTVQEIIKKPELESGQLNFPPLLCGTSGPPFQVGRGLWQCFPTSGSQADVAGAESGETLQREEGEEAGMGRDDSKHTSYAFTHRAHAALHGPWKLLLLLYPFHRLGN